MVTENVFMDKRTKGFKNEVRKTYEIFYILLTRNLKKLLFVLGAHA